LTLLKAFPDSIDIRDRKGRNPTDLVKGSSSANKETVLSAIRRFQIERGITTTHHDTHAAAAAVVPAGGSGDTNTVTTSKTHEVDYEHRTVLFRMVLKKEWKPAALRAANYPEEASTWIVTKGFHGNLRFLPLHKACVLDPPPSIIEALLEAYPDGARDKDQDGWLPLHCAWYVPHFSYSRTLLNAPFDRS